MRRVAGSLVLAAIAIGFGARAVGQTTAPADANAGPQTRPGLVAPPAPAGAGDANSTVVVPALESPVVVPSPRTAPADAGEPRPPKDEKYAKCLLWLKMARKEAANVPNTEQTAQLRDYLHGTLMTEYISCGEFPAAKVVYDEVSTQHRLLWLAPLVAGMLVEGVDQDEAMRMFAAVTDQNVRQLILRRLAAEMVRMEALDGLVLVRKLPPMDQAALLGEWTMRLVLAGKLVNARIVAEGAPTAEMRQAVGVLDLAGRVAHGEKTVAEAQAASGKTLQEFVPFVIALNWAEVKDLDPNVAREVLRYAAPGLSRGAMAIGMAKNFIRQRRYKVAEVFANGMMRDLQAVPTGRIPGPVFLEIAGVLAGVGRFDAAKTMFERGLANPLQPLTIDSILTFFDALIAADGGDLADRLSAQMPKAFRDQVTRLWARHYIKNDQPDQVRELLAKQKTPDSRAWLYVGVATALREMAEEPAKK